jgi:UDP-N-acetylmuramoyl-L-alanyl-D-glutamate--2,6-diaminopimelate ligase
MSHGGPHAPLSLRSLLPQATWVGANDIDIRGVSNDSQMVRPGDVFVAIRGPKCDGHAFAADAARRGASGVVAERPMPEIKIPQCIVAHSREALGLIAQAIEGNPASQLKVVGVTGTNGKSTTAMLIRSIIEAAGGNAGLVGTIEYFDGHSSIPANLTTPDAVVTAKLMRRMVDAGCTHAVMEVSSHALDQRRVAGIRFDTAVFTNLSQDHLDYHGDLGAYREAKATLFRELTGDACAVLNADDPASAAYAADCRAQLMRYAVDGGGDFTVRGLESSLEGSCFLIDGPDGGCEVTTPLVGLHNVYNCLAAAAVGRRLGLDWPVIGAGIERLCQVPGRLEAVHGEQPYHVWVDYAHTPQALAAVLQSLRTITPGRVLCLFGAGGDRDRTKRPLMAAAVEAGAEMIVVTSDNPRTEDPQRIIGEIVAGFRRVHALAIEPDRRAAIEFILGVAEPGDCVLLAGKGHEAYQIIGDRKLPFDDRVVAAEFLRRNFGAAETSRVGAGTEKRPDQSPRRQMACGA